jgi:hypothetical protein
MSKLFGASALICAVLTIFIPSASIQASAAAIVLAVFAGFMGERIMASTTPIVVAINGFFLSFPISIVLETGGPYRNDYVAALLSGLLAPFAAMLLGSLLQRRHPTAKLLGRWAPAGLGAPPKPS